MWPAVGTWQHRHRTVDSTHLSTQAPAHQVEVLQPRRMKSGVRGQGWSGFSSVGNELRNSSLVFNTHHYWLSSTHITMYWLFHLTSDPTSKHTFKCRNKVYCRIKITEQEKTGEKPDSRGWPALSPISETCALCTSGVDPPNAGSVSDSASHVSEVLTYSPLPYGRISQQWYQQSCMDRQISLWCP